MAKIISVQCDLCNVECNSNYLQIDVKDPKYSAPQILQQLEVCLKCYEAEVKPVLN